MGASKLTNLPLEPSPPEEKPQSGVVVLGRFQPVHKGHELLLKEAEKWRSENASGDNLIIAIGSSNQPLSIRNPWTSAERAEMLEKWLESTEISAFITHIPDIEDPPNWVSHAEKYHGTSGVLFTTDPETAKLYESSGWKVIIRDQKNRETFQGWRVRATAQMLSTVHDQEAIRLVLGSTIPDSVLSHIISEDYIRRLAYMGEGGEPVG